MVEGALFIGISHLFTGLVLLTLVPVLLFARRLPS